MIGHINKNSIRNKFEPLVSFINNNLDILIIPETKIDDTLIRLDLTAKGEGFYYISERIYPLNV